MQPKRICAIEVGGSSDALHCNAKQTVNALPHAFINGRLLSQTKTTMLVSMFDVNGLLIGARKGWAFVVPGNADLCLEDKI